MRHRIFTVLIRLFVERIELIPPAIVAEVKDAVIERNRVPIAKHGRFLSPILARVLASGTAAEAAIIERNLTFAYASAASSAGSCR